ncbi:MAG: acyltransferase [Candidatus Puniceispirillum sp. TMED52]|nr:acyltransferase [SAR116 cluster bacterium]OUU47373.1 MAG: acyltransferase [Candidatus Puniceispirillum sp. TMED52]HCP18381.1 acyltransferase [Alphaproteobacteria bacterium]
MRLTDTPQTVPIFSFADGELGPIASRVIRSLERFTGQPLIRKIYLDYINDDRPDSLFWQDAVDRLNISVNVKYDDAAYIPPSGRLLVIANHPFGVVDGLVLCSELSKIRSDYKIITHEVLRQAPAVMHQILPINFSETAEALATNMQTRHDAMKQLKHNGALILFPSGAISLAPRIIGTARDTQWKTFVAKLAQIEDTTILPVFFDGQNSISYMMARRLSQTLGYSLMFREICRLMGQQINVTIRKPISNNVLRQFNNRNEMTEYLRNITYGLDSST